MMPRPNVIALLSVVLFLPSSVSGDWLVMRDKSRIETSGPWRVDGQRVLFTTKSGTLSALRLAQVDLAESTAVTAEAKVEKPAAESSPAAPPRAPALVLDASTNRPQRRAAAAPAVAEAAADAAPAAGRLEVESWKESQRTGFELELEGTLRNGTTEFATDIVLEVTIFDTDGKPAATKTATVERSGLPPGERASWRASFPGTYFTQGAAFKVKNRSLVTNKATPVGQAPPTSGGR